MKVKMFSPHVQAPKRRSVKRTKNDLLIMTVIKCDECSEMRKQDIVFETIEQYLAHLRTSGHEINYAVYMDLHTR